MAISVHSSAFDRRCAIETTGSHRLSCCSREVDRRERILRLGKVAIAHEQEAKSDTASA
jgi:hypothetical protein